MTLNSPTLASQGVDPQGVSPTSGSALAQALHPLTARFARAVRQPATAQAEALARILRANADSAFGRAHGFEALHNVRAFQAAVPIQPYAQLASAIERIQAGEPGVLTTEPVLALEPTSGSTGANKLIPITRAGLAEVQAAIHPWLADLMRRHPGLETTRWYTAISPLGRTVAAHPGGPPIGLADDAAWLGAAAGPFSARLAVPNSVGAGDVEACRLATAVHLLAAEDLGFISVWSPTFLTLLLDAIERDADALLRALAVRDPGRARVVSGILGRHGGLAPRAVWPHLRVVSCWTEGASAPFAARLAERLAGVAVEAKGLWATEGAVSVPLGAGPGAVLAVAGHFLEFLAADDPAAPPCLAHELAQGGEYVPLLTTGGGLYRYPLPDRIRVVGVLGETPRVAFLGRQDGTSDLCGEKLAPRQVGQVWAQVARDLGVAPTFVLLAPEAGPTAGYVLYLEGLEAQVVERCAAQVEAGLAEGVHYAYCRALGQLAPVRGVGVQDGLRRYERAGVDRGGRAGTLKAPLLEARPGWWAAMVGP